MGNRTAAGYAAMVEAGGLAGVKQDTVCAALALGVGGESTPSTFPHLLLLHTLIFYPSPTPHILTTSRQSPIPSFPPHPCSSIPCLVSAN